jgi:hypothetical protein
MSTIVLEVKPSLNRWAIVHNDVALATFATKSEAQAAAIAVAVRHPPNKSADLDLPGPEGALSRIRIF